MGSLDRAMPNGDAERTDGPPAERSIRDRDGARVFPVSFQGSLGSRILTPRVANCVRNLGLISVASSGHTPGGHAGPDRSHGMMQAYSANALPGIHP